MCYSRYIENKQYKYKRKKKFSLRIQDDYFHLELEDYSLLQYFHLDWKLLFSSLSLYVGIEKEEYVHLLISN